MQTTRPTPPGWPRLSVALTYQDPIRAIDWLVAAFDFSVRIKVLNAAGSLEHSELEFGEAMVMVAGERGEGPVVSRSPRSLGGAVSHSLFIYVDDVDAHCTRALAAGAVQVRELATTDYGAQYWSDRGYSVRDPEGHVWHFAQRLRDPPT